MYIRSSSKVQVLLILSLGILTLSMSCKRPSSEALPNIIYILADDLGYGDVSAMNPEAAWETTYIDQIAKEGIRFTDAHSGSAVCSPTRYGVLTGRYSSRHTLTQ